MIDEKLIKQVNNNDANTSTVEWRSVVTTHPKQPGDFVYNGLE